MSSRERQGRVPMQRVALVAPRGALRAMLVEVADAGVVDLDEPPTTEIAPGIAGEELARRGIRCEQVVPLVAHDELDPDALAGAAAQLVAGDVELERKAAAAIPHGRVAALLGWVPAAALNDLRTRIEPRGAAAVALPVPVGVEPPTLLAPERRSAPFRVLVDTYGTVRYEDVDPTPFAAVAFGVMFGMMFGDVGRGLLLLALGLWARTGRGLIGRLRPGWALIVTAGGAAVVFGFAYGEFFGPTGVLPSLWLVPLDEPVRLLIAAILVGAVLLGASNVIGAVNRWHEGGWRYAVYEPSGIGGMCTYAGLGMIVLGVYEHIDPMTLAGALLVVVGVTLVFAGRFVAAGGHGAGFAQASVESVDGVIRVGANVVSFARLAAFGLTAAAIGSVVWDGTTALWRPGLVALGAVLLFVVGNLVAFALEGLVVGVQALRLEYYELFSRIFGEEGRPFRPWHVAVANVDKVREAS